VIDALRALAVAGRFSLAVKLASARAKSGVRELLDALEREGHGVDDVRASYGVARD
jgi:hypothetical protein